MKFQSRVLFCLVSLLCLPSSWAQSPSLSEETAVRAVVEKYFAHYANRDLEGLMRLWSEQSSSENALAEALVKATTEEEQERLLAQAQNLMNRSLLEALKKRAGSYGKKGDHTQALKLYQLIARIAERRFCDSGSKLRSHVAVIVRRSGNRSIRDEHEQDKSRHTREERGLSG